MKYKTTGKFYRDKLIRCQNILKNYGVEFTISEIRSKSRRSGLVFKRALVVNVLDQEKISSVDIGSIINRDHATVLQLRKYLRKQSRDPRFEKIRSEIMIRHYTDNLSEQITYHLNEYNRLKKLKGILNIAQSVTPHVVTVKTDLK